MRYNSILAASVAFATLTVAALGQVATPIRAAVTKNKVPIASATGGRIVKFTDGAGSTGDSIIFEQSGTGWIGINTAVPTGPLHLFGSAVQDVFAGMGPDTANGPAMNYGYSGSSFGRGSGFFNVRPDPLAVAPNPSLRFVTANIQRMIITNTGSVGIGLPPDNLIPVATLDVRGTAHISGDVTIDGNVAAKYQDVAEWVPVAEGMSAGTVVVISNTTKNTVGPSLRAYDTRVAGVVSAQPGLILGEASSTKAKIATTGRVKVRVDATSHPIAMGDLLVTSDTSGAAMYSEPLDLGGVKLHRPGTLIGKALEPLPAGQGEILVLLSLQ